MTILVLAAILVSAPDQASAESLSTAEARFREGLDAYDAHEYDRAATKFEESYRASSKPELLFNIAQTYRLLGDCRRALERLDTFIAAVPPTHPLLPRVRAAREQIGSCDTSTPPVSSPPQTRLTIADDISPLPRLAATDRSSDIRRSATLAARPPTRFVSGMRNTCAGAAGGSLALAGAGLGFGAWALSSEHSIETTQIWDPSAQRNDERGRTLGLVATTLLISAGLTTLVATASCLLARRGH
jgi:hypothetical protein